MLAEISAGLGSLKAAKDIVQGLNAAKTEVAINEVKINLQGLILDAQQGLFAAQEAQTSDARRISQLEQEIVQLKDWSAEKERYELADIGQGALGYRPKQGMESGELPHYLCANCFDQGQKTRLQPDVRTPGRDEFLFCNRCKADILIQGSRRSDHPKRT